MARVLLLDGYDDSRAASARELAAAGHDVTAVEEEEDAIAAIGTSPFDVVLLDLPFAEAVEAANAMRAAAPGGDNTEIRVIAIVSPTSSRHEREAAHRKGIDYFVLRPCPPGELVKHLRRLGIR